MRILIATPFYASEATPSSKYARGLLVAFKKRGDEVVVISFEDLLAFPSVLRHLVFLVLVVRALSRDSVVLALDTWSVALPSFFAARLCGARFSMRVGGDFLWEHYVNSTCAPILLSEFYSAPRAFSFKERVIGRLIRLLMRRADAIFFTTKFQRDLWKEPYPTDPRRVHLLENYVPRERVSHPAAGLAFVASGRDIPLKNMATLRAAFTAVASRHEGISLDTRVLPPPEHRIRIAASYAVIIPSFSEVYSNTAIDAVAAGKPFIVSRDTGTSERLGQCGLFIDTRSTEEMEQAIERLLDAEVYKKLVSAISQIDYAHSWDEMAREVVSALEL